MSISEYIKRTDEEDAQHNETRRYGRVDPTILLERSFAQWNLIDSLANAVIGWLIICVYLFTVAPKLSFFSIGGITFFLLGLICFANIFGVLLYLTNYIVSLWQKKRHPPFPDLRYLKKLGWVANIVWFLIMFGTAKISFDLTYSFIASFVR